MYSFLYSPAFIISITLTLGAVFYAYVYLPRQMRKAYRQGLLTLARAVETKDKGYLGHGERVAGLVAAMARELNLSPAEALRTEYAAFLQDIGNVRVPHAYLNKGDELTDEELEVVKTHSIIGAEIVGKVEFLQQIAPIIRHHHEAWDGSGYPDGLREDAIPLGSRIIAVCTAYDAMTHVRAYRKSLGEEDAIKEIRAGAGTKYDPLIVDTFLRMLKKQQKKERLSA